MPAVETAPGQPHAAAATRAGPGGMAPAASISDPLPVSAPGDLHEVEAERIADAVMRQPSTRTPCACGGGCASCAGVSRETRAAGGSDATAAAPAAVRDVIAGPGRPLEASARAFFEPRFGRDLGDVRVHDGETAAASAEALDARAYTVGRHVVLGRGESGEGGAGRRLMAHELAHVAQQTAGRAPTAVMRQSADEETEAPKGRELTRAEWARVKKNVAAAAALVKKTLARTKGTGRLLMPGADPRLSSKEDKATVALFEAHFKSSKMRDVQDVEGDFQLILAALNGLGKSSFRVVTNAVADGQTKGDTYAFVEGRAPVIHLAERYFDKPKVMTTKSKRSTVSVVIPPISEAKKARLLVHEAAHFKLGAKHAGGVFGVDEQNCAGGFPVKSFRQATDNAYVYGHFAECAAGGTE